MLKFLLDPFGDVNEGDLSLSQLWTDLQIKLWWGLEAIPGAGGKEEKLGEFQPDQSHPLPFPVA